jgi:DNA-directed RNA polymerase subunit RPC12/RpoP
MDTRFRDPAFGPYRFLAEDIAVACPHCGSRAVVKTRRVEGRPLMSWPRRLICPTCTHAETWSPNRNCAGRTLAADPFFGLPLWLQADVRGHRLWAFNEAHLAYLKRYVAATLRERPVSVLGMTLVEKLPAWLKSAKLRPGILRAITRLEAAH